MKVTFIKPNMGLIRKGGRWVPYVDQGRMEPLTFATLAGLLPPEVECALVDDRFETVNFAAPTDLVALNVEVYTARRSYEIAAEYRRRGVPVVLGGFHVTLAPEEALEHADAIVVGDAEGVFAQVVADAAAGRLQRRYEGGRCVDLSGLHTRWDLFEGKKYLPLRLTWFSRGCVNRCAYCATAAVYGSGHRHRPVEEVVEELKRQDQRHVFFVDDNIVGDPDAAARLFEALLPLRRRWVGQGSLSFLERPGLGELMVRSGCAGLVVGFETLSRENLRLMDKGGNLRHDYTEAVAHIRRLGLQVWAAFLLGYDHDDARSIAATAEWAVAQRFTFAAFNILSPYPSTPLYDEMKAQGRLLFDRWWLDPRYRFGDAVFQPARMRPEELSEACFAARRRFNGARSILYRATDRRTNAKDLWSLGTYFAYNPLFRRELYKKHQMRLGYGEVEGGGWVG